MTLLRGALRIELATLTAIFVIVVASRILLEARRWLRHPDTRGVRRSWTTRVLRLQMPAASLLVAVLYLAQLPQSAASGSLPTVPDYALALLAGSHAVFLIAMGRRLLHQFEMLKDEGEK